MTIKLRKKPVEIEAIQWDNNEPFIRYFVKDDRLLRFPDSKLEVWNIESECWVNVPHKHYVVRGVKGELYPMSPEILNRTHEIIE